MVVGVLFALSDPGPGLDVWFAVPLATAAFFAGFFLAGHTFTGEREPAFSSLLVDFVLACFAVLAVIASAGSLSWTVLAGLQRGSFLVEAPVAFFAFGTVGVLSNGYICHRLLEDYRHRRSSVVGRVRR